MADGPSLEISRPFALERLGETVAESRIEASGAERAALAKRFGLLELARLEATVRVRRAGPGRLLRLDGHLEAEAVQACVVSLEPVNSEIREDFTQFYGLDPVQPTAGDVAVAPGGEEDDPEPLGSDGLDLGEAVAQQLALALDPYPRAPGAKLPAAAEPGSGEAWQGPRPFDVLRSLKPR